MSTINNVPKFFWIKDFIVEKGVNIGHNLFSLGHIIWLLIITDICIFVYRRYKKASKKDIDKFRKTCALILFILEYVKLIIVALMYPALIDSYIPIHLCSFAGFFIIFDALWPNNKLINSWWLYIFFPCGLLGVLSPSTTYPWFNFFAIHEFLFHGLLIVYGIFKMAIGEGEATYSGLWKSSLFIAIVMIPIYYIDVIFDKGYMLLTTPADFPLTILFWNIATPILGQIGYIALLLLMGLILFHTIYFISILKRKVKKKISN
ncbi:MAG: YwaF family protein [Bacilli bacterium]|nr:YwaF family protein [Bacilli bacterium]